MSSAVDRRSSLDLSIAGTRGRGFFERVQMSAKALEEVDGGSQAAEAVFAARAPKERPEPNRLVAVCGRLGEAIGNRLEDALEPVGLDSAQHALPEHQVAQRANGGGSVGPVHYRAEQLVARGQGAAYHIEHAAVVQLLEYVVGGQDRFGVVLGCPLDARAQLLARVARRDVQ